MDPTRRPNTAAPASPTLDHEVLIVGAGFAGLGMAIRLRQQGIEDFLIVEKAGSVAGTWRENTYPGCACDVPSHMYSFSFEPNPDWSEMYAPQEEIRAYLERCTDKYGLRERISFNTRALRSAWDEELAAWRCVLADAEGERTVTARFLVSAIGGLHIPAKPRFAGIDEFRGQVWHSAEWNHDYDLAGKRVAVVGTGASAIQIVPAIADRVARMHLFQRTAPWVLPKIDRRIPKLERRLYRRFPALQRAYRRGIYLYLETVMRRGVASRRFGRLFEWMGRRHLARQVTDPEKRRKLTPRYEFGCKRLLMSNDYYEALDRPNAEVVTDAISAITPAGIVTADGTEHEVDAIILGTGFDVQGMAEALDIRGVGGASLAGRWRREGIQAHRGTMSAGFPNLFFLLGPNTGLGHNSVVFMAECQIRLALDAMRSVRRAGAAAIVPSEEAQLAYNVALQRELRDAVWSRCSNWYTDEHGRNISIWPGTTWRFAAETLRLRPAEYRLLAPPPAVGAPAEPAFAQAA